MRGATIAAMILVNGQFSREDSYSALTHAEWNGWTFADTIFPGFLFVVGVSLALSTASRVAQGESRTALLWHAVRRALVIFALGTAIDYLRIPAHEFLIFGVADHIQLTGVLQKIAVCYLAAFAIYLWAGPRGAAFAIGGLTLLYLGLLYFYPVPGCGPGSLTASCDFPNYMDEAVLHGFRWNRPDFDPDGIGTVLPATASVLFGVLAGQLLADSRAAPREQLAKLLAGGIALIAAGELLSVWVPINKQLWTISFAVLMAGLAASALACFIWLVEERPRRGWSKPLQVLGSNAIAAYLISRVVVNLLRVHVAGRSLHGDVLARVASPSNASLLFALAALAVVSLAVWLMDRQGWHLKI